MTLEVDCVIGADGANSRVAKEIDAGEYDYAIAFQVCGGMEAPARCVCPWCCTSVCISSCFELLRWCSCLPICASLFS
jgi:hypothetical protein